MTVDIRIGDCRQLLAAMPDESVHCVVTSPPYFGLRDYGVAGQIGLEPTPDAFVAEMVAVFRDVRRVLRDDGTLWLNLGDSYASSSKGSGGPDSSSTIVGTPAGGNGQRFDPRRVACGVPDKNLLGIPWRVAFALQADGWVLRQEIIWAKPNPMPESVTDRCTKSHEQIFLFAKAKWSGPDNGRFAQISDQDARWLACCIDTEGCIVVKRTKQLDGGADSFAPQVSFGSTNRALIDTFVAIVGHGNVAERPGKNSPMFYWQAANNIARDFLHRIYPYLIVKQRQARVGIHLDNLTYYRGGKFLSRKQRTEAENAILVSLWERSKMLNRFGNPDLSDVPEPIYGRWSDCARYWYDADAVAEAAVFPGDNRAERTDTRKDVDPMCMDGGSRSRTGNPTGDTRNRRSVWTVATQPFSEAHFATFPPDLIEPCIKAGCPKQCCAKCGAPVTNATKTSYAPTTRTPPPNKGHIGAFGERAANMTRDGFIPNREKIIEDLGQVAGCACDAGTMPGTVLDPFGGAGTTGLVADRLGRNAILLELNPTYAEMARRRIANDAGMFAEVAAQ
jgi:DNA modification methylase